MRGRKNLAVFFCNQIFYMLYKDPFVLTEQTFKLIQRLQTIPEVKDFHLVGGTALALQLGHRNSIDIDLFSVHPFDDQELINAVRKEVPFKETFARKNTIIGFSNGIKIDFIHHNYPYVLPPVTEEGITYLSKEDIAAMKINAIHRSGQRLKDFVDIYFLLEHFSVEQMMRFFVIKYPDTNPLIAVKALHYFEDIDTSTDPPRLRSPLGLERIKKRISEAILRAGKTF